MAIRPFKTFAGFAVAALMLLLGASTATAAEAMVTGVPKFQVRVGDLTVDEHWTTSYTHRATYLEMVTVRISGAVSCTMVEGPVDPAVNEVTITFVDDNRMKQVVMPNPCDQLGYATGIYEVGETWIDDSIYELGGVDVPVGKKNLRRRYPIRVEWAGGAPPRTRVITMTRTDFRKGFRRVIYDTDFDNYVNICINEGLDIRASGGHLYCVWEREPSSLVKVRVRSLL